MSHFNLGKRNALLAAAAAAALLAGVGSASAATIFTGNLVVSALTYEGSASTITVGQDLPNCTGGTCIKAISNGSLTQAFQNDGPDGNFGVTAPYSLDFFGASSTSAALRSSLAIPDGAFTGSYSSKSEGAINVSPNGQAITLLGYNAGVNQIDISNSNTPGSTETGNTDVATPTYRTVAQVNANGTVEFTNTNAFSGNNGRAVILGSDGYYYMAGNAGNGNGDGNIATLTGLQRIAPGSSNPNSQQIGAFNVTQVGLKADKASKDNNYRGLTDFDNTLFTSKGSGSNGVNTVYQVGATGSLPTTGDASTPIVPLSGLPIQSAKKDTDFFPFGVWFANATTMYVADEGDGVEADAASSTNAGLQKWSLDTKTGVWSLDYVLQNGLGLGVNYTVSGTDAAGETGSLTAATDGLRNITGKVNADGTVTIYGVTSTVDDGSTGDQGADPDRLVAINDILSDLTAAQASGEGFNTLETSSFGQVFRGVALVTPVPEPATWAMMVVGLFGLGGMLRRRRRTVTA